MNVELTPVDYEVTVAEFVGWDRWDQSRKLGIKSKDGTNGCTDKDTLGALAELLVAKYLNVYWAPSVNSFNQPDLILELNDGTQIGIHVRQSPQHSNNLIVRERDQKAFIGNDVFVLLTGDIEGMILRGCMPWHKATEDEWRWTPPNWDPSEGKMWLVPQSSLEDL